MSDINEWESEWDNWDIKTDLSPSNIATIQHFKKAKTLVLPSGGIKGTYILGAIQYLYDECGIKHIKSFYGTSIGAIISGLLIIGYTPLEILVYICVHKIINYLLASFDITKIFRDKSILDSKVFITLLTEMIVSKVGSMPTLGDLLTNYGKRLCICTISRENSSEPLYISSLSHPTITLIQALHMSSSIPFVFGYAEYDNVHYFDGGLLDQFPISYASLNDDKVFGIDIKRSNTKKDVILDDIIDMISLPMNRISFLLKKELKNDTVYIEIESQEELTSKNNLETIKMFTNGFRQCKQLLFCKKEKIKKL